MIPTCRSQNLVKPTVILLLIIIVLYSLGPQHLSKIIRLDKQSEWIPGANYTYPATQSLMQFVKESEEVYKRYLKKRDAVIAGRDLKSVDPWVDPTFWNYFAPSISCPFPTTRVGYIGDGGKWICGFREIAKKSHFAPCVIYSFGVGGDSSFEDELLNFTNCSVFAFDPTVNGLKFNTTKYPGRVHFDKVGLGANSTKSWKMKSLKEIMIMKGHTWIDILKVDIEEAEFPALKQVVHDFPRGLPFAHLNVEIHLTNFPANKKADEGKQFSNFWEWWAKLEKLGLRAFINEENDLHSVKFNIAKPRLIEYGFINIQNVLNCLANGE